MMRSAVSAARLAPAFVLFALASCDRAAPEPAAEPDPTVVERGAEAARLLREGLVERLTAALDSAGPVAAIEVCADDALVLTDSIARAAGAGIAIRRTSDRVRNPANAPDAREREALDHFAAELSAGRPLPTHFVQPDLDGVRYYEPLRIMAVCTQCHGPIDHLDPAARQAIAERYPQDRAVGYAAGDFRGLIRVTVPVASHDSH